MTTSKKPRNKLVHIQYHLDGVVITKQIAAESIEDATERGRALSLTELVDLGDSEWVDGDARLTGVYEI